MKIFHSIHELLGELGDCNWDSALFINQNSWETDPMHAEIPLLEGDDELEDVVLGTHLPKISKQRNMKQLFDLETFRDIVNCERKRNPDASVLEIIFAVNFYREKDNFYDPHR